MQPMPVTSHTVPPDRNHALLEVVCHAILYARNCASEMPPRQLYDLMDAVHNIPIYLQHSGDDFWDTIQFDIARYDEKYQAGEFPKLQNAFHRGMQQYTQQIHDNPLTTDH